MYLLVFLKNLFLFFLFLFFLLRGWSGKCVHLLFVRAGTINR